MVNRVAGFSDDLLAIQGEVEADVGTILKIAKKAQMTEEVQEPPAVPPVRSDKRQRAPRATKSEQARLQPASESAVQNVTTRLTQRTNELLTEAALRQRLSKATPATRQDIIEEAICEWLARHGYAAKT